MTTTPTGKPKAAGADRLFISAVWLLFVWLTMWSLAVAADKGHCKDHGAEYSHTEFFTFKGYCLVTGVQIPAGNFGDK